MTTNQHRKLHKTLSNTLNMKLVNETIERFKKHFILFLFFFYQKNSHAQKALITLKSTKSTKSTKRCKTLRQKTKMQISE